MDTILRSLGVEVAGPASSSFPAGVALPVPPDSAITVGGSATVASPRLTPSPGVPRHATAAPPTTSAVTPADATLPASSARPLLRHPSGGLSEAFNGFNRLLLEAVHDEEENEEDTRRRRAQAVAAEEQATRQRTALPPAAQTRSKRSRVAGVAAGPSHAVPAGTIEPAFEFAPLPNDAALASNADKFVSEYMLQVVANWPQTPATAKRRRLNGNGDDCPGATAGAQLGTNASLKTWATRIRVACSFANFIGRTVCWHPNDPRPTDQERDRGVRKFFRCLSPFSKRVIVSFLNSRRKGLAVAGGGRRLSAVSLKDFTNGLSFMFGEAKIDGPNGDEDLVIDCADRTASWKAKGEAEYNAEKAFRADPGNFTGNPMTTTDLKNWRSATQKQARLDGEQSKSAAAVTPELMKSLHNELFMRHVATDVNRSGAEPAPTPVAHSGACAAPSDAQADHLNYTLYVLAFISLARPATLLDLKFEDVTYPDMKLAENSEFFNMFLNVALRVVKTGTGTTDILWIRFYSYFAKVSSADEEMIGQTAYVQCNSEHLNFPQLFRGLLLFACSAPGVGVDASKLNAQYVFPSLLQRSVNGAAALFKKRSETELNSRFVADLERIGMAYINGERACRMYGFRRGGAQALLNETGLFEQVMRLGGWRPDSNSFLKYVTSMNSRGTLRSTLRSFRKDEVTQVVAHVVATYNRWAAGVVRDLCSRALGEDGRVDAAIVSDIETKHVKDLCSLICQCVLVLRHGSGATEEVDGNDDDSSSEDDP